MPSPDGDFVTKWVARGAVDSAERWERLTGGNTNDTWRVGSRIVKRFREGGETPIFGNDAGSETLALRALAGTGLAPRLVDALDDTVVYERIVGQGWTPGDGVERVAEALRRLHAVPPPDGLPMVDLRKDALVSQTMEMGGTVPVVPDDLPPARAVFMHGDATASNALVSGDGVTFIDWQCPAVGDPVGDIAVFLSPAMQAMSGNRSLDISEVDRFLVAYGSEDVTARYRALAPLYAARMRAYCRWRAARGDEGYGKASLLEQAGR